MQCATHPNTAAIGLCVACRAGVCGSCSTRLQGRNFCVLCLSKRTDSAVADQPVVAGMGLQGLVLVSAMLSAARVLVALSAMGFALYMMG